MGRDQGSTGPYRGHEDCPQGYQRLMRAALQTVPQVQQQANITLRAALDRPSADLGEGTIPDGTCEGCQAIARMSVPGVPPKLS